ncbi:hypothetical protein H9642_18155 [Pseudomonadaceae bacterium Sa2CUA2]|uniref:N-acetyltransferase domain-containing protein n=2 Tax=Serpens gallinarum TaxID=2763075 RepID=A0ABR8TUE2_9PSED|nr:hypothetical protein [Serpens gallinarum]
MLTPELFRATASSLDAQLNAGASSRWTLRALVDHSAPSVALLPADTGVHGPLELNRLKVSSTCAEGADYVWLSRNDGSRTPPIESQQRFIRTVQSKRVAQERIFSEFDESARSLLDRAESRGLRVLCHDPYRQWGGAEPDAELFADLLVSYFHVPRADADEYAGGTGYGQGDHYVFAMTDETGSTLCFFVLAPFAWGFEGTFTMVDTRHPARALQGVARTLMLIANALVLDRHGVTTMLYGEANKANISACVSAGYGIVEPEGWSPDARLHRNVVWADNPMGDGSAVPDRVPLHSESSYENYALMLGRNDLIAPLAPRAYEFIGPPSQVLV